MWGSVRGMWREGLWEKLISHPGLGDRPSEAQIKTLDMANGKALRLLQRLSPCGLMGPVH